MSEPLEGLGSPDEHVRARAAAVLGHGGRWQRGTSEALSAIARADASAAVRVAALRSLARRARPTRAYHAWLLAVSDTDVSVRRGAAGVAIELAPRMPDVRAIADRLVQALDDSDPLVAESCAFALGEIAVAGTVAPLAHHARDHRDPLVREACVAALGSLRGAGVIGSEEALPVLLDATRDKPAIRRRAVIALTAFDGPDVDAAIAAARTDRDWQVRMLAEDFSEDGTT